MSKRMMLLQVVEPKRRLPWRLVLAILVVVFAAIALPGVPELLREPLVWFGPLGLVKLMGSEVEQATAVEAKAKREIAQQVTATATGTLEEIVFMLTSEPAATEFWLGIAEDNAGAPGTILGSISSKTKPKAKTLYGLKLGTGVAVTNGTKYWLVGLSIGGAIKLEGKTGGEANVRLSTKETFAKIETTSEWAAATEKGPILFYGLGTEGGGAVNQPQMIV